MELSCSFGLVVYRMEYDQTKWSYLWNSDQNCAQNSAGGGECFGSRGVVEVKGWLGSGIRDIVRSREFGV